MRSAQPATGKTFKPSIARKVVAFFGSILAWLLMHMLFLSCRKYVFGRAELDECIRKNNGKAVSASWHRCMFYTVYYFRGMKATLMASRSSDGELITAVLKRFGYVVPRGSSGRGKGGQDALEEFVEHVDKGNVGGLAVDGPKGPPHVAKSGICVAAARTGAPIIPHMWYAESHIRINSWDRTIIPKPFSRLVMILDREPIYIGAVDNKAELERQQKLLTERLLHMTYQADHWFKLAGKYPDPRDIPVPQPVPDAE